MLATRSTCVKRWSYLLLLASLAFAAAGCGGSTTGINTGPNGEVAGVVFDADGNIVRDADVFIQDPAIDTISNSSGTYILHDVPAEDLIVRAQVTKNGVIYIGQNLARVFSNDRARNVNIVVVPESDIAQIHGTVFDSHGDIIAGARVFAVGENNLSSSMALTDNNGNYSIHRLAPDVNYQLNASTPDFRSDNTSVILSPGDDPREDFTLSLTTGVSTIAPPTGLSAIAWTSPDDSTRSISSASAYEQIKRLYDPKRAQRMTTSRLTPSGDIVEIDLTWNQVISNFLLGYGIYIANGPSGTLQSDDFLRDPLAEFYADTNENLAENSTYSFALTSINTDNNEGAFSSRVVVSTIDAVTALNPTKGPLTFHWQQALGATSYVVFLFDEQPRVGVNSIWSSAPVSGSSLVYSGGPSLTFGHTYYVIVLGLANSDTSRSISQVVSFTA